MKRLQQHTNRQFFAIALMVLAMLLITFMDVVVKSMRGKLAATEIVWLRYATHIVLFCLIWRVWRDPSPFRTKRPGLQILRGFTLLGMSFFNFSALAYLQLAEANAIMFGAPLLITALASPLLGERVGPRRWIAVLAGFAGILVVLRPGTDAMHWAMVLSVCAAMSYAAYSLMTRWMSATESPESLLTWSAVVVLAVLAPFAIGSVTELTAEQWLQAFLLGAFGGAGHYALVWAYRLAQAPVVAPFMYTQMIWMILAGFVFFDDVPDAWTLTGAAVIALAGLYVIRFGRPEAATRTTPRQRGQLAS